MPQAKKTVDQDRSELDAHLERLTAATPTSGWQKITHSLELAFIHALAGAEGDARALLADAEAELAKFAAPLSHLKAEFSMLAARVLAVLHGK